MRWTHFARRHLSGDLRRRSRAPPSARPSNKENSPGTAYIRAGTTVKLGFVQTRFSHWKYSRSCVWVRVHTSCVRGPQQRLRNSSSYIISLFDAITCRGHTMVTCGTRVATANEKLPFKTRARSRPVYTQLRPQLLPSTSSAPPQPRA